MFPPRAPNGKGKVLFSFSYAGSVESTSFKKCSKKTLVSFFQAHSLDGFIGGLVRMFYEVRIGQETNIPDDIGLGWHSITKSEAHHCQTTRVVPPLAKD